MGTDDTLNAAYSRYGGPRRCERGCGRPAINYVMPLDLAVCEACNAHYLAALASLIVTDTGRAKV